MWKLPCVTLRVVTAFWKASLPLQLPFSEYCFSFYTFPLSTQHRNETLIISKRASEQVLKGRCKWESYNSMRLLWLNLLWSCHSLSYFPRGWRFLSVFTQFVLNEQTLRLLAQCQGLANNCSPICGLIYLFLVVLCKNLSYQVPGREVLALYMLRQLH